MKLKKITFLFFCAIFLLSNIVFSQQKTDSLNYHVILYNNAKNTDDLVKAFKFFENDKEHFLVKKFYPRVLYDLYFISNVQHKLGSLYDSEASAIEALRLLDNLPIDSITNEHKESFFNHLGILKRELGDYKNSLKYYSKSLSLAKTKWDSALAYNNIGVVHIYQIEYQLAKSKFKNSVNSFTQLKDSSYMSLALSNLGFSQAMLGETIGLPNMMEALQIRKETNNSKIYESYKNISEYYKEIGDKANAIIYAEQGYLAAKKFNSLPYKKDALNNLIDLKGNKYAQEYLEVDKKNDSIKLVSENKYAEVKYSLDGEKEKTKNAKILALQEQSKRIVSDAKATRNQFFAILILFGSFFLFYVLGIRHKKGKLKIRFETERQISKRLHDEVANDVFSLMSKLESDPNIQKELIDSLEVIYLKTRDISKSNAALDVSEEFDILLKDLIASYKTENVNIFTRNISQISWNSISNSKKETLYRVIQELMTNMIKHSKASVVTLLFEEKKKKVLITYIDNGVGSTLKYGNGLRNVENRMEMAGCSIIFESETNNGFQAKLTV